MSNVVTLTFVGEATRLQKAAKESVDSLDKVGKSARDLEENFGKAGDGIDQKSGRIGKMLSRFGDNLTEAMGNTAAKLPGILGSSISSMPPQGQALGLVLVTGLVAFLAPAIGAAVISAVLLALGGGALVAGIMSAMQDDKLSNAFKPLISKAQQAFKDFGEPFKEPLYRAIGIFSDVIDFLGPFADRIGKALAPMIDELAPAVADFIKNILPGITDAIIASVPLFETIAKHAPKIGKLLGEFFEKIGENAPAGNEFLDDMLGLLEKAIDFTGDWISWLGFLYINIKHGFRSAKETAKDFWDWVKGIPDKIKHAFGAVKDSIPAAFKAAFNGVANAWNNSIGGFSWSVPWWIPGLGGNTISVPNMPRFHGGGVVPGVPGTEVPIMALAGEEVGRSNNSSSMAITINSGGSELDDLLVRILSRAVRGQGGNVQEVLGGRNA